MIAITSFIAPLSPFLAGRRRVQSKRRAIAGVAADESFPAAFLGIPGMPEAAAPACPTARA
jgi:hypothetical protein